MSLMVLREKSADAKTRRRICFLIQCPASTPQMKLITIMEAIKAKCFIRARPQVLQSRTKNVDLELRNIYNLHTQEYINIVN